MKSNTFFYIFSLILLSALFLSCDQKNPEQQALMDEVMAIHDEVMPKMDDIMQKKKLIDARILALKADSAATHVKEIADLAKGSMALKQADDAMMNWMRNYKPPSSEKTHEEIMAYLNAEKLKITEVKEKMLLTLATVDALLKD